MLPVSAKRRVAFTPPWREQEEPKPVYFLRVPTVEDKAEFNCALLERRARFVGRAEFCAEMRRAVEVLEPANAGELLAMIERAVQVPDLEPLPADDKPVMDELEAMLQELWPAYARLVSANTRWYQFMPVLAARLFLTGWQNGPDGQARTGLDDAARSMLPPDDLMAIGLKAFSLMRVGKDQEKNSAAPSGSPTSPPTLPVASEAPTAETSASTTTSES